VPTPSPLKTSTTPPKHQQHQQTARFDVMMMVDARPKVGVGVDDVFVPPSTNRLVLMFQVGWWCCLCLFKCMMMLLCCAWAGGWWLCFDIVAVLWCSLVVIVLFWCVCVMLVVESPKNIAVSLKDGG